MHSSKILWVDIQPSLFCFNRRAVQALSQKRHVRRWSFQHDPDESCSQHIVESMLYETIENLSEKYHLIGHGLSGSLACCFAAKHPELVESLTLISVDTYTFNNWSSHYLKTRGQLCCDRLQILSHLSTLLFEPKDARVQLALPRLLARCLDSEYIQGSLITDDHLENLKKPHIPVLVVNGDDDYVIDRNSKNRWEDLFSPGDFYKTVKGGRHFLQFDKSKETIRIIENFLDMVPSQSAFDTTASNFFSTNISKFV